MKNYADQGGCYPPKPKAEADNTLRDLHNSSYHTKAEFNNCFIIHSKYFQSSKNISLHNFLNRVLSIGYLLFILSSIRTISIENERKPRLENSESLPRGRH